MFNSLSWPLEILPLQSATEKKGGGRCMRGGGGEGRGERSVKGKQNGACKI